MHFMARDGFGEPEGTILWVTLNVAEIWLEKRFKIPYTINHSWNGSWSVTGSNSGQQICRKNKVVQFFNLLNHVPGSDSLPCLRIRSPILENNWSTSSWVWPTGRKLIWTYSKEDDHIKLKMWSMTRTYTFLKIPTSTSMAQNANTYLFLFSRTVLSIWIYNVCGKVWASSANSSNTFNRIVMVRLLPCGYCRMSTKLNAILPWALFVWTRTPVIWVRSFHRLDWDLAIIFVWGRFVFAWSMPSMIIVTYLSGSDLDFSRWCWYFLLACL